jgi:siroheme synthase-like protein
MASDSSPTLRFLPVGLKVQGKRCLVVGGGGVGTRKALTLARAGADVTVVAPSVSGELAEQAGAERIRWLKDSFRPTHLQGAFLVVAATDDEALNAELVRLALRQCPLVCDASSAERSEVIFGALLSHHEVTVAVFTDGRDPAEARRTRDQIADLLAEGRGPQSHPESS